MKFYGQWNRSLDERGRIAIPKRFKGELMEEVVITKAGEYLRVYPKEEAEKFPPDQIWRIGIDKQGRISIPTELIKSTSLGKRVTWHGEDEYLELRPQKPVKVVELIRTVLKNIKKEVKKVVGKEVPYSEITIEEILELHRRGIAAPADGDRQVVVLTPE